MDTQIILRAMCTFFGKDIKRVNHLLKVYAFAQMIGKAQGLDDHTQQIVEAAAAVHDIGIKESERKYGSSAGKYQGRKGRNWQRSCLLLYSAILRSYNGFAIW